MNSDRRRPAGCSAVPVPAPRIFDTQGETLFLRMPRTGADDSWLARPLQDLGLFGARPVRALQIESAPGWRWDIADAAFLARVLERLGGSTERVAVQGLPQDLQTLLDLARPSPAAPQPVPARSAGYVERAGAIVVGWVAGWRQGLDLLGHVVLLLPRLAAGRARVRAAEMLEIISESSSRAVLIVGVVNVLMGAILAFVGAVQLQQFGAGIYVANLVGIASARELTPILTAIVLAGRTGASFAARIATMQGNEEVDALVTLGVSPVEFLVVPRVVALSLLLPLLYVYGCALALLGGMAVAVPFLDMSATVYTQQTQQAIAGTQFAIGALKALVFGALVGLIGCHFGLQAERSAAGVGASTTDAVVVSIVAIIVMDAVFAVCANALGV
jgi:phospholipid/cholesterol/gamma-HCH transport system permease protein